LRRANTTSGYQHCPFCQNKLTLGKNEFTCDGCGENSDHDSGVQPKEALSGAYFRAMMHFRNPGHKLEA
jgi:predicted amidophosphoribosyltransferase